MTRGVYFGGRLVHLSDQFLSFAGFSLRGKRQEEKQNQGDAALNEDTEFHYSVTLASDNSVVLKVTDILMEQLRNTRARQVEGRRQKSPAGHRRIVAAIKRHDAEAAKAAMRGTSQGVEEMVL